MALDSQMREEERGLFKLDGITGMLIATVLLLSILAVLTVMSFSIQKANATNGYTVDQDINAIKFIDSNNAQYRQNQ
jgi:hypothetical protein